MGFPKKRDKVCEICKTELERVWKTPISSENYENNKFICYGILHMDDKEKTECYVRTLILVRGSSIEWSILVSDTIDTEMNDCLQKQSSGWNDDINFPNDL